MKKILILVIALALVGGMAMAQTTIGGQVETRVQRGDAPGHSQSFVELDIANQVDEFNRVFVRVDATTTVGETWQQLAVKRAHTTTDLGAILGSTDAGIGIMWRNGLDEWGYANVGRISAYNWTGLDALGVAKPVAIGTRLSFDVMGMLNVHAAMAVEQTDLVADQTRAIVSLDGGIDVGVGTAVYELVFVHANSDAKFLGVSAGLKNGEFVDDLALSLTTSFHLDLDGGVEPEWFYNVGVQALYGGLVNAEVALIGEDGEAVDAVGIGLGLTPVPFASLQFGVGLGLGEDYDDAFNSFDGSVQFALGRATARFGYYWLADDATGIVPANFARLKESGMYARVRVAF